MSGTSTSSVFAPQCYPPRMTRAQALARRTAGTLSENCVIVITDGPLIGVTEGGGQVGTEIELNPTSPTSIGLTARIWPKSFVTSAFPGMYDIDQNIFMEVRDNQDNRLVDYTGVLFTLFPFFYVRVTGNEIINNNNFNASVSTVDLVGWGAAALAGAQIQSNRIASGDGKAIVDLTSLTGATSIFNANTIVSGVIRIIGGVIPVVGIDSCQIRDNFYWQITGNAAMSQVVVDGCVMTNRASTLPTDGTGTPDFVLNMTAGSCVMDDVEIHAGGSTTSAVSIGGTAAVSILRCELYATVNTPALLQGGAGNLVMADCQVRSSSFGNAFPAVQSTAGVLATFQRTQLDSSQIIFTGGNVLDSRVAAGFQLTTGGFNTGNCVLEGNFVRTPLVNNANRIQNQLLNNYV